MVSYYNEVHTPESVWLNLELVLRVLRDCQHGPNDSQQFNIGGVATAHINLPAFPAVIWLIPVYRHIKLLIQTGPAWNSNSPILNLNSK